MALLESRAGDSYEHAVSLEFGNGLGAAVAHSGFKSAEQLVYGIRSRTLIRHAAFYALGNELFSALLEVSVLTAVIHRAERTHASVDLELTPLVDLGIAGRLLAAREYASYHYHVRAGRDSLYYIARVLDSAVAYYRDVVLSRDVRDVAYSGYLGNAYARYDSGRTYRAGAYSDLDRVRSRLDQKLRGLARRYVSGYDLKIGEGRFDLLDAVSDIDAVAPSSMSNGLILSKHFDKASSTLEYNLDSPQYKQNFCVSSSYFPYNPSAP